MKYLLKRNDQSFELQFQKQGEDFTLEFDSQKIVGKILSYTPTQAKVKIGEKIIAAYWARGENWLELRLPEGHFHFDLLDAHRVLAPENASGLLYSNMPGKILKLNVSPGDRVETGDLLVVLEAMKMEHRLYSSLGGVVEKTLCQEGERVSKDQLLVEIREEVLS